MLSEALPIYSGGLGNVAGDQMKAASDLGVPVVGVGLLYGQGYFRQDFDSEGRQQALYPVNDPGQLPIRPLRQPNGEWLRFPHSGSPESRALRRFRSRRVSLFRSHDCIRAQSRYSRLIRLFSPGLRNPARERLHRTNRSPSFQCIRAARSGPNCLATLAIYTFASGASAAAPASISSGKSRRATPIRLSAIP